MPNVNSLMMKGQGYKQQPLGSPSTIVDLSNDILERLPRNCILAGQEHVERAATALQVTGVELVADVETQRTKLAALLQASTCSKASMLSALLRCGTGMPAPCTTRRVCNPHEGEELAGDTLG